jgi:hypothetical protein
MGNGRSKVSVCLDHRLDPSGIIVEAMKMLSIISAAATIVFFGGLACLIARQVTSTGHAKIAGMFLALGFAMGSFGGHAGSEPEHILVMRGLGYLIGIISLGGLFCRPRMQKRREKA